MSASVCQLARPSASECAAHLPTYTHTAVVHMCSCLGVCACVPVYAHRYILVNIARK